MAPKSIFFSTEFFSKILSEVVKSGAFRGHIQLGMHPISGCQSCKLLLLPLLEALPIWEASWQELGLALGKQRAAGRAHSGTRSS